MSAPTIPAAALAGYLDCLERADPAAATRLALDLLDAGVAPADLLIDLVAVAQREVGERWRVGRWSVAQEHAATHVSERVVGAIADRVQPGAERGRVVLACVEGEWHALAARLVAEVLRADGWQVTFLGASVPPRHLVSYLHQTGPDAVLLSCLQSSRLVRAARVIESCRLAGVPVIAGGPGFGPAGRWASVVGAAAWGATARDAARLLAEQVFSAADVGAAPVTGGDEHLAVLRRRRELVDLATRIADPSDEELDSVAAEVGHLVDALAAAIRVGDPALVTEFVRWQGDVLTARGGPSGLLDAVLDGWATVLVEHPQARDYLDRARAASRVPA
ncbi:cobalamin-dependent protein [Solwaraspora sp. WMMD1047]|uniref:cobalamin B12-binding domain-containing protein n=1 Tax=Solwaraspora sp. WMMD1047 TaxID=3016102 RepID=UPI002417DC9E|nr:cobalamin-dependent protein [Solwaraspora sp. WMMD1047]MDG4828907.1 cobalamin-dependent protein [Solwaraspora sp. WMMD1047]